MRLYDNAPRSGYEELKTFYPVWYRDVQEMDALWRVFGNRLDDIQLGLKQAINNCYISTADEETIKRFEEFFYITYDGPRTLEERRALVASFFIGNGHIGEQEIKELMSAFTSGDIAVALVGGTVEISVTRELSDRFNLSDSTFVILKRIPAHLNLSFKDVLLPIKFSNNEENFVLERFRVGIQTLNNNGISYKNLSIRLFVRQPLGITGTIKMDTMYRLNGEVLLNGSRRLNAKSEKEEI